MLASVHGRLAGPDTVTDAGAEPVGNSLMSYIYAVNGDVTDLSVASTDNRIEGVVNGQLVYDDYCYHPAKPVQVMAGGDIVHLTALILQNDPKDISMIAAQGTIFYPAVQVGGAGTLEVTAGSNIFMGSTGYFDSIGPMMTGDTRLGADVVLHGGRRTRRTRRRRGGLERLCRALPEPGQRGEPALTGHGPHQQGQGAVHLPGRWPMPERPDPITIALSTHRPRGSRMPGPPCRR